MIAVLLICNIALVVGKAAPVWDAIGEFSPWFSLVSDNARHGRILLWDPWIDGGSPDFAEPEAGAASPIAIFFGLIFSDPFRGFVAYWLSIWILSGIGMLLLCKHLKCPPWGAIIVSLGFATNGFFMGHGEHTSMLYSYCFLPWILWRFDAALKQQSYWAALEAGALWGASALGGYPQITILTGFFIFLWGVGRLLEQWRSGDLRRPLSTQSKFFLLAVAIFAAVGTAILCPTYISFFTESRGYSARADVLSRDYAITSNLFPPGALSTFASPALYLLQLAPTVRWANTDVAMVDFYLGVLIPILAIVGLLKFSKLRIWLAFVAALFMSCAVGKYLPVRGWLYDFVPPTRFFRNPSLFGGFTMFAVAILAAFATRDVDAASSEKNTGRDRLRFFLVAVALLALAFPSFRALSMNRGQVEHPLYAAVHFWLVWLSISAILFVWWRRAISARDLCWALITLCVFDAASTLYLSTSTLYSSAPLAWWNTERAEHNSNLELGTAGLNRNLHPPSKLADYYAHDRNIAIKDPELANYSAFTSRIFESFVADPFLYRMALGPNRMWFSSSPAWCVPDQKAFDQFEAYSRTAPTPSMVLHSRSEMMDDFAKAVSSPAMQTRKCPDRPSPMSFAPVKILRYSPNRLSLSYRGDQKGWLMITDRWARSWQATVNGKATPIVGANFLFRGVPVSAGENVVAMWYRPTGYIALIALSWTTLGLILLSELWRVLRTRLPRLRLGRSELRFSNVALSHQDEKTRR